MSPDMPMRFVKKVGDRGTLTLPLEVREALGIEAGDLVILDVVDVVKHVELQDRFRSRREAAAERVAPPEAEAAAASGPDGSNATS